MGTQPKLKGSWLTVNRRCNLRCTWCYAQGTEYNPSEEMSLDLAFKLINLKKDLGIPSFIFIGGEPSLWPHLFVANNYAHDLGLETHIATNGLCFTSPSFLDKMSRSPFDAIGVSLKAGNAAQHLQLTGSNTFHRVLKGIRHLADMKQNFDVSLVLTPHLADNLTEAVEVAADAGAQRFLIDFCVASFSSASLSPEMVLDPRKAAEVFARHYARIDELTRGKLVVHASIPFCAWPDDLLGELKKKGQLLSGCHVFENDGVIFDPQGKILACNSLHAHPLGEYGKDFFDAESFNEFWDSPEVRRVYNQIISYPSRVCIDCPDYSDCGGGCPLQWFMFNPDDVISNKSDRGR